MKKSKVIIQFVFAIVILGCASESQQKGLDQIGEQYKTKASFSKGFQTNAGKSFSRFNVKVSGSPMLDTLRHEVTASNIALMLYDSFTDDEKDDYDYIHVELKKDSLQDSFEATFDPKLLSDGLNQVAIFTNFSDNLLHGNYEAIAANVDPKFQSSQLANNLKSFMNNLHATHGNLVSYKRIGFGIVTSANNKKLFHYSGHLHFSDGYIRPYFVRTSKNIDEDYISGYHLN